jgi:hypothetical protein
MLLCRYLILRAIGCASAGIGPHRLESDQQLQLGNCPLVPQPGDAFSPQPRAIKDPFLLRMHHDFRQHAL